MAVLAKAVLAVDLIARSHGGVRLADAAQALGLPKSSAHRLLTELATHDVLRRDELGRFLLGPRLLSWGVAADISYDLRGIAAPHMQQLSEATGESVNLHVVQSDHRVCIAVVRGAENPFPPIAVGQTLPLGIGATGRVLLAFSPEPLRQQVIDALTAQGRSAPTPDELSLIRAAQWATSVDEQERGLAAAATVIRGPGGQVIGALAIGGDVARFPLDRLDQLGPLLLASAHAISTQLTGPPG
ncbi:IclR family transcriptional regulator [Nocardioides pacificus]